MRNGGRGELTGSAVARFGTAPEEGGGAPGEENGLPVARLHVDGTRFDRNEPVTLSAAGSTDPEGRIVRYEYDLDGDGTFELDGGGFGDHQSTSYATYGTKRPRVRITDAAGATDIATAELEVVNVVPEADLDLLGSGPVVRGRSLSLSARADDPDLTGESLRVSWDLDGDGTFEHPGGTVQNGQTVELAYTPAVTGVQSVAVEMIDDAGGAGTARLAAGRRREPAAAHLAHPERGGRQEGRRGHLRRGGPGPRQRGRHRPHRVGSRGRRDVRGRVAGLPAGGEDDPGRHGRRADRRRPGPRRAQHRYRLRDDPGGRQPAADGRASVFPESPTAGSAVSLDASDSADADGSVTRYRWDLDGDGAYERDTGADPGTTFVPVRPART